MAALAVLLAALNGTLVLINGTLVNTTTLNATTAHHNGTAPDSIGHPLAFMSPHADATRPLRYDVGQQVNVSWTSPFEHTTLEIWQGLSEGGVYATLAANYTQNQTSVLWEARPLRSDSTEDYHFRLRKGHRPNNCDGCTRDGSTFEVVKRESVSSTTTSTPSATAATDVTANSTDRLSPPLSKSAKLGIGLGVGLGAAVGLALLGVLILSLNRRREREQAARDLAAEAEKTKNLRYSSGNESEEARSSAPPESYHPRFEFEGQDGRLREGFSAFWYTMFGRS